MRNLFTCFFIHYKKYRNAEIAELILKSSDGEYFSLKCDVWCFQDNGRSTKTFAKKLTSNVTAAVFTPSTFLLRHSIHRSVLHPFALFPMQLGSTGILCLTILVELVWRNRMTFLVTCRKFVWRDIRN